MLRTLGANRRQILTSVVAEAFIIGLAAAIVGVLAGIALRARGSERCSTRSGSTCPDRHRDRPGRSSSASCSAPG